MLQENIKIVAQRDNLFKITATSSDTGMFDPANAKMATAVVQKLIDIFVEENMEGHRPETQQPLIFLDATLARGSKPLPAADSTRSELDKKILGQFAGTGCVMSRMGAWLK